MADPVATYLAATRITPDPSPLVEGPVARYYVEMFGSILTRLKIRDSPCRPSLYVTYSGNALVESLVIGDDSVLVYDQYLGQSFNRLTDFAMAEWPAEAMMHWSLRHLAVALASRNAPMACLGALALAEQRRDATRPSRSSSAFATRAIRVAIQEYFVMAHESVHLAPKTGEFADWFSSGEEAIKEAIAVDDSMGHELGREVVDQMLEEEITAVETGSREYSTTLADIDDLRKARSEYTSRDHVGDRVAERPHLVEEMTCDLIATDLAIGHFATLGVDAAPC